MDWPSVANTFIATLPAMIAAVGGLIALWRKVEQTHHAVNSKMTELLEVTKKNAAAEATIVEKEAQGARDVAALEAARKP